VKFGSDRGGNLLPLCRTLLRPWSLYVSIDPRFSAPRSTNAFHELEARLPWRSRIARQPFPSQQPADIVTQRAFSLILWPILSQLLFGQFRVVAQRLVSEFALCHPTFLGEPHEDLYPFFLTFLGTAKLSRR